MAKAPATRGVVGRRSDVTCLVVVELIALPSSGRTSAVVVCRIDRSASHAGTGGARNRAISIRISLNICRDTATSANYRRGQDLATVRTLMPEVERQGRTLFARVGASANNQKAAIDKLKEFLGNIPVSHFAPIECITIYAIIENSLFAMCYTEHDALKFGSMPNRHAELHGLASYGDIQGATTMLCIHDFLMHALFI